MMYPKFFKNKYVWFLSVYIVVLILFAVFSYRILFHDTYEYILMAKKLAGFLNNDVFIVHSLVYSFFISLFLKFFPSILTIKLINISWIVLIGLLLYASGLKKTSFLIWVFSPITWITSIIISPIVPTAFFLLAAYLAIKKWQKDKKNSYFIISALALGLSAAFYDPSIILIGFFILAFFYDKSLKETLFYSLFTFLSFSTRLILDASLFSLTIKDKLIPLPFYSLIRFFGARLIIQLGLHPAIPISKLSFSNFYSWDFLILISPLLFCLYKLNFKKNKNVIIFLILSTILFIFQGGSRIYFITLAPLVVILLSQVFKRKELFLHILISSFLIIFMVYPYFIPNEQEINERNLIIEDLKTINKEFSFDAVIFDTGTFAMFYLWDKNMPYSISSETRNKILKNDNYYSQYVFEVKPKVDIQKIFELKVGLKTNIKKELDYENLPWLLKKGETRPEGYQLIKCYKLLCVYEKEI